MEKNVRKWTGVFVAIICYFIIHEGAHWAYAMYIGVFKQINFGFGIQVDIYRELTSDMQLGIFCLVANIATIVMAYVLLALTNKFVRFQSDYMRAIAFYLTIVFLMTDPLYLSIVFQFVGGGDMNGIKLILPELPVRVISGIIAVINIIVILKIIAPKYRKAFPGNK